MFIVCLIDSDSKFSHVNFKLSLAYCQAGIHSQCRVVTKSCDIWFRVHFSAVFVDVWAGDFVFVHCAGVEVTEHRCIASALWSGHRCAVKASDGQLQPCSVDLPQSRGRRPCWTVRHGGMDLFSTRGETVQRTSHPHRSYVFEGVFWNFTCWFRNFCLCCYFLHVSHLCFIRWKYLFTSVMETRRCWHLKELDLLHTSLTVQRPSTAATLKHLYPVSRGYLFQDRWEQLWSLLCLFNSFLCSNSLFFTSQVLLDLRLRPVLSLSLYFLLVCRCCLCPRKASPSATSASAHSTQQYCSSQMCRPLTPWCTHGRCPSRTNRRYTVVYYLVVQWSVLY